MKNNRADSIENAEPKPKKSSTRSVGAKWERAARGYLKRHGYKILGKNYRTYHGEIDIIAYDRETCKTVFVEVKSRNNSPDIRAIYGRPAAAVTRQKRGRFLSAVYAYQREHPHSVNCRMDVIEVYFSPKAKLFEKPRIVHIKSAFGKTGYLGNPRYK